jgi:hypothetical protein
MYSYVLNKPLAVSVSQIAHISQLNHLTLMIDLFFLKLENNLADKKDENMFINENELIEYSEKLTINYENLFCSDYLKSEVRKYIVEKANSFDSQFATDYDKIYIDNWFDFITSDDLEQAEIKEDDKDDNISLYSQSESEDENAVYIETEEEEEEEIDDEESEEEEEDLRITINELAAKNANHIREKEVLMERIKFLEMIQRNDTEIINQLTKKRIESDEKEDQIKNLKAVIDDLRIDLEEMKKDRDDNENNFFEILKKKDEIEIKEAEAQDALKNHKIVIERLREEAKELKYELEASNERFYKAIQQRDEFQKEKMKLKNELEEKQQFFKKRTEETLNFYYDLTDKKNEEIKQLKNERDKLKEDYEQMYKDRQHFCNLNSERCDELRKIKKQLDKITEEKKERIGELDDIIWDLKNERDDLKKRLDFKTKESDYFNKRAFDNAKEANTLNNKIDKVKNIIIE